MNAMQVLGDAVTSAVPGGKAVVQVNSDSDLAVAKFKKMAKTRFLPGVGAGVVGSFLWKKHRVLGFFSGYAVGENAYGLVKGNKMDRTEAVCRMAAEGAAVGASLYFGRNSKKKLPKVLGYIGGGAVAGAALLFVPGRGRAA